MATKGDRVTVYGVRVQSSSSVRPGALTMESIPGTVRGTTILLDKAGYLSDFRMTVGADAPLSPEAAVTAFQVAQLAKIEGWRAAIAAAEASIDESRSLIPATA